MAAEAVLAAAVAESEGLGVKVGSVPRHYNTFPDEHFGGGQRRQPSWVPQVGLMVREDCYRMDGAWLGSVDIAMKKVKFYFNISRTFSLG